MNNKKLKLTFVALSIVGPLLIGLYKLNTKNTESLVGIGVWFAFMFGIPLIFISGLVTSLLTRGSKNKQIYSTLGFLLPALLVCSYELFLMH